MRIFSPGMAFVDLLRANEPEAMAQIRGNTQNPQLKGVVKFYRTPYSGVLIEAEIFGLPDKTKPETSGFFAMHIHENGDCTMPFDKTGMHYNPSGDDHPNHAGDLIPLLSFQGYAWLSFFDKRFQLPAIRGKNVIIHQLPDDFTTQPSGGSGEKIGCGIIS